MSGESHRPVLPAYTIVHPQDFAASPKVFVERGLFDLLVRLCLDALPHKAFGLIGGGDLQHPRSVYPCVTNLRNEPEWKPIFDSFGDFYRNPDLGFVISPAEVKSVLETMEAKNEAFVGVFHSHRFLRGRPTEIDIALSADTGLYSYIVSVADPAAPEIGVFSLGGGGYQTIGVEVS